MKSISQYRDLVEQTHDLICTHDLEGRLLSVNAAPARILGYEIEELLRIPMREVIAPEFRDQFDEYLLRVRRDGVAMGIMAVLTRTGERRFWEYRNTLSAPEAKAPVVQGVAHDVTERIRAEHALRESEERLRLASQAGHMYAYEWDAVSDVVIRSDEFANLPSMRGEPERTTRRQLLSRVHPDDRARFVASVTERTPENPTCRVRYRVLQHDGSEVWIEKAARAFFDRKGKMQRMIGVVADITERKFAEEMHSSLSRRLIEAQETERSRIARELHDDIGQRLALLTTALERLKETPPTSNDEVRSQMEVLRKQASNICVDVQALSHQLHSFKLEHLGLVAAMRGSCREFSTQYKVEIDFTHKAIPKTVTQEISLCLLRVLQEALHNAAKHSGVCHFEVELHGTSDAVHLVVRDFGRGFDLAMARRGRGLGLISMEERLKLVEGKLSITSQLKHGTTICASVAFPAMSNRVAAVR